MGHIGDLQLDSRWVCASTDFLLLGDSLFPFFIIIFFFFGLCKGLFSKVVIGERQNIISN